MTEDKFEVELGISADNRNYIRVEYGTATAIIAYENGKDGSTLLANLMTVVEQALEQQGE